MKNVLTMRKDKVMKQYTKYICVFLMMIGISTNAWGTSSSFDGLSSITVNDVDWGTSTTSLSKYIGYDNGSIVTSATATVWFQLYIGDEFENNSLFAFIEDPTDGFGISITASGSPVDNVGGYINYVCSKSAGYCYNLEVGDEIVINLQYVITSPRTSHTATLKFKTYDDEDLVDVLSIPITIYMTGGYTVATAVSPSATGSVTAKVNGSSRTRVMSNEQLDLVATPEDGYMFTGWAGSDGSNIIFNDDEAASTYAFLSGNQTITATFDVACTRHTITLSNSGTGTNGSFSADKSSACEDATITLTATPSTGYELDKWTVSKAGGGTCTVNGSNQFSMPDENVTVSATFKAATYSLSFNANGGSGSMDAVDRVYNSTAAIPANTFIAPTGKVFDGWATSLGGDKVYNPGANYTMGAGDATLYAHWRNGILSDYKFSCADWSVTGPSGDTVFITSTANKTVRSQEAFHVTASGLPASTALTFTTFPANTRYAFKKADGSAVSTDTYGKVNTDFYVFYTPKADDSSDGLDEITTLYLSVTGEPRKDTLETKTIIGRHLPTNFVIAAKRDGKWVALPSNMTTGTPSPVEIAVDDATNPSIAYTATTNIYSIAQPAASEYIRLKMNGQSNYPLFGSASTAPIGKSSQSNPDAADIGDGYLWKLVQKRATGLSDPKEAKYLIYCKNNSTNHLRLAENAGDPKWGLYASGIEELRIIPASSVVYTEAEVVAWGQKKLILEVALPTGATQARAKIADGSWSVNKSVATTTGTSVKGTATKYNYTLDFTSDGFDFAANEGKMLIVELLNGEGTALRATSVLIPRIIAADRTINKKNDGTKGPWNTEVHVLPGDTLFIDADTYDAPKTITIKELNIYPGATVNVVSGTLIATTLILRNGWDRLSGATNKYDVARLYLKPSAGSLQTTNTYMDWYIDFDQYYPVAVPWKVTIANMSYKNSNTAATAGTNVKLRYYDGASRAANVQTGVGESVNWKEYGATDNTDIPTYLIPSLGYAMTAKRPTGKAFSIIRMPLTIPADSWITNGEQGEVSEVHKDQVSVTAHGNASTPSYAQGWNLVANPYMSLHQGALSYDDESGDEIEFANIPDINFKEYDQLPIDATKLKPSSAFLVQAPKTGTVTFGATNRKASVPSFRQEIQAETYPRQKAYIVLANDEAEDMMGIWISDKYSAEYEINADLEKLMGDGKSLRTYMHWNEMKMAYLAINATLAQNWIPVSVRIEKEGEHSFSMHRASTVSELKGVYLIDYQTGETTNLLEDSYPFYSTAGTINGRFAINAIVGPRDVPTELDIVRDGQEGTGPIKFIYHDKVFILHQGVIYDSTGKKVREIKK